MMDAMSSLLRSLAACGVVIVASGQAATSGHEPTSPERGTVLVANQGSADATLIDLASGVTRTIQVGSGPHEAVIAPSGRTGVVTVYGAQVPGNQLAVIDMATATVTRTISLDQYTRPHGAWFLPGDESRVVLTSETTQNIVIVNIVDGKVEAAIPTLAMGSHMVAVTADGSRAFTANVASGGVSELDLKGRVHVRTLAVAPATEGIAVTPDGREVWVGSNATGNVAVIDTKSWSVVATVSGFTMPYRLAMSADGRLAAVCDPKANSVHVVDVTSRTVLGSVSGLASPRGVHIAPDGKTAFVTMAGDSTVGVVDLTTRTVLRKFGVGKAPDGVWYGPGR
jgi:YVTN family beta-propeller protein